MARTFAVLVGGLCVLAVACAPHALADDTGKWEDGLRKDPWSELSDGIHDLWSGKKSLYWDRGPTLESEGGALAIHMGLELQYDTAWYGGDKGDIEQAAGAKWIPGHEWRRARVALEVFLLRNWYFRARYGWDDGPTFDDLFIEWSGISRHTERSFWPTIRLGQVKEPMTIDWMNGAKWTTFAERAMFTTTLVPNRTPGIRAHATAWNKRLTYQAGFFNTVPNLDKFALGDGQALTGRITGLPWAPKSHLQRLLHIGVSGTYRRNVGTISFDSKPETWLGPDILDTGMFEADEMGSVAAELFFQYERFSATVESAWTQVTLPGGEGRADYRGWYGALSYFVTGEGLTFNRTMGVFGRIQPKRTVFCPKTGGGALELTARYSMLDLDSGSFPGGKAESITLGANWYPRDNMRVTLNGLFHLVKNAYGDPDGDGTLQTLMMRVQYDL